jgi:hypothetical protein
MKKITLIAAVCFGMQFTATAQLAPQASPLAKVEQKVGFTDVTIQYSRPSKNGRTIFGDLVPLNELWRTGANENTKITFSDGVAFGKDSLKAGTYAVFTRPGKTNWEVIFYSDATNWGLPENWDDSKVALRVNAKPVAVTDIVETFTISIDKLQTNGANLTFAWDKTKVIVPFAVPTDVKVMANINRTMAGPSANDYNGAANYYLTNKKDLKQALEWSNKATEMDKEAFWMLRTKSLIQAELGDRPGAIASAKAGLALAEKAGNKDYQKMFNASIAEWSKKK